MSTTVTVFSDVDSPSPGFSTTTVSPAKEELGPGWAMDDVYPPLAELRRALLTDEEWAAMSSWEKDVWEMFYRPDWERLACIEQILVDTPAAQRARRHEEALRSLGASTSVAVDHLDGHVVSVDAASSAIIKEGPEDIHSASTGFITIAAATCSMEGLGREMIESRSAPAPTTTPTVHMTTVDIDPVLAAPAASAGAIAGQAISGVASTPSTCLMVCLPRYPENDVVLVASSPPTPKEYVLDTISICVAAVPMAMTCEFYAVVNQPMPWPSFLDVHHNGDEIRPLPWPSFRFSDTACYDTTVCIGSWLISGWHQEVYCSSFSCDTVCESILAPTIFSFVGANLICFFSAEVCALLVGLLRSGARIKSEMSKDAGTHATNVIIAVGISHSSTVRSRFGTGHAGLFQEFILMCWLQEQLLATWPAPIASCSVPKNMFLNAELSTLVICEFCGYMFRNVRSLELKCPKPEAFVNCATHDASYWPGNFVPVVQMQVPEQDRYLNMLADWLLQNQIILTRTSTARITEWILTQWDPGQEVVLSDFTKVSCSQAVHDTYLKKLMLQNLNVSDSNDSVSLGVLVCWSIGAGYLAWISYQEKKFSYVVVFKEYSEPKLRSEHQRKAIIGIGVASWSDLRVLIQFSWCTLNPWPPLRLMVCSHLLLLEHVSMGVELTHAGIILCLQNRRVNITKYIITTWFTYRILVHLAFATQLAVRSNCRQLDLGTKTAWYSDSKYSIMVVHNSALSVHVKKLQGAYVSAKMEWDNLASVLSCGLIHLGSLDSKFACSVMGRPSLFILIQSVALKNMEPSWSTTALLTEIASMFSTGFSVQPDVDCSIQSVFLFTHAYQLSILAPTMFTSAWCNLACIFSSSTVRCALQVTSSELLVFIVAFGTGQGKFPVEMTIPSSPTDRKSVV